MNALKLAERLAAEQKQLEEMRAKRKKLLNDSQSYEYSEWVTEHAAMDASNLKKEIDDKEFLIEGIKAKLKTVRV